MEKNDRPRYEMRRPELNELLDELLERAGFGDEANREPARQIAVTALRLLGDPADRGELRLVNNALKELRHAFRVFAPYERVRKVSCFGSARVEAGHPDWQQAVDFAQRIVSKGWMVITGAGHGIMGAAQVGAGREASFGLNIRLPFEQQPNEVIADDPKLINFRYFFTRKVMFVKEAHAIALFPGGFGTHDEAIEALTLIQTGKSEIRPVVLVDSPGDTYWLDWREYLERHLRSRGLVGDDDLMLFRITDDVDEAVNEVLEFYSNYHSSRYVGRRLVIRVRHRPSEEQLDELNSDFADLLERGTIRSEGPLPQEQGECPDFARLVLHFNRYSVGRMRQLIDRLNGFVPEHFAPPGDAAHHEIVEGLLSPEAERLEREEISD